MLLWVFGAVAVLGASVIALGFRGKRIGRAPHCRACGFDLTGLPGGAEVCSECGRSVLGRGTVPGTRRRSRPLLAIGAALVLAGIALGTLAAANSRMNLNTYKPVWLLALDLRFGITADPGAAWAELSSRSAAGTLKRDQVRTIAARLLTRQADRDRAWNPKYGDFLEIAWANSSLSEEQFRLYLRQTPVLSFEVRPRVEASTTWLPNRVKESAARVGTQQTLLRSAEALAVSIDGGPARPIHGGGGSGPMSSTGRTTWGMGLPIRSLDGGTLGPELPVGRHTLRAEFEFTVSPYSDPQFTESIVVPFEATFEIVPAGGDAIELVRGDNMDEAVRSGLTNVGPAWFLGANWGFYGYAWIGSQPRSVPLAMDVFWLVGEPAREVKVGWFTAQPCAEPELINYHATSLPKDFQAQTVRVVLRPSTKAALNTVDLTRIWGGEIDLGPLEVRESTNGSIPSPQWRR